MAVVVVSVPVSDAAKARAFYVETLRLRVMREEPMGPDMRWIQLQPADGGTSIALVTWFDAMPPGSMQGLMLGVDDIDVEHARLSGLGIELSPVGAQPWGRATMLKDPDGNGLILAQLTTPEEFRTK